MLLAEELRVLLLELLEPDHVLLGLVSHRHREVVVPADGETSWEARRVSLHPVLSLHSEHLGDGPALERLEPPPAHHGVHVTNRLEVLAGDNSVGVEDVVRPVVNVDDGRGGGGCGGLEARGGVGSDGVLLSLLAGPSKLEELAGAGWRRLDGEHRSHGDVLTRTWTSDHHVERSQARRRLVLVRLLLARTKQLGELLTHQWSHVAVTAKE